MKDWHAIRNTGCENFKSKNSYDMLTLILLLTGSGCFWLFYKAIDFFDKI